MGKWKVWHQRGYLAASALLTQLALCLRAATLGELPKSAEELFCLLSIAVPIPRRFVHIGE